MLVSFHPPDSVDDALFRFAVIVARYEEKWVLCRHRDRSTWEIPGGKREIGEAIAATAERELAEETGAAEAILYPVTSYSVTRGDKSSYGMLFFAVISSFGPLSPEWEMAEIGFFDRLPCELTYPEIQPYLFDRVQGWLNIRSGAGELWDLYTQDRRPLGRTHRRGDPIAPGEYHLVVHVWVRNRRGEYLLTKRSPNKGYPLMWECTGGSALAGDDSLTAALREMKEETGLILRPECGRILMTDDGEDYIGDIWLFEQDFDPADVVLLPGETCDVCLAAREEILRMYEAGDFVPYKYLKKMFASM